MEVSPEELLELMQRPGPRAFQLTLPKRRLSASVMSMSNTLPSALRQSSCSRSAGDALSQVWRQKPSQSTQLRPLSDPAGAHDLPACFAI